ncbi:hypothetical protein Tco_0692428, partial [Tanacetum coccineum]
KLAFNAAINASVENHQHLSPVSLDLTYRFLQDLIVVAVAAFQMNLNSSSNHHSDSNCLYSKLTKGTEQCKKQLIDLNLPAFSNEIEELLTHNIPNFDDEAVSRYAGTLSMS